jgi:phytoene/squalene synthetase
MAPRIAWLSAVAIDLGTEVLQSWEMSARSDFYQSHLDRVSRSFAFCIRQLPDPLRDWVALSYLLCRVVDTIEDSAWTDRTAQIEAFQRFDASLMGNGSLADWANLFPADIPAGEKILIGDAAELMTDFHQFPTHAFEVIKELVLSMSQGMQHFCAKRRDGSLRLSTLGEVNQYCFFVAGVVGELLAKLVAKVEPKFRLSQLNVVRAHHFGLFLQKVNLLKDQVGDEELGRHLIPSREVVEDSSQENAARALDFLLDVPKEQIEFRRFCAWSLFLGLQALSVARESLLRKRVLKVPRGDMEDVFAKVEVALDDDVAMRSLFDSFAAQLGWPKRLPLPHVAREFPEWIRHLYHGPLDSQSMNELGLTVV